LGVNERKENMTRIEVSRTSMSTRAISKKKMEENKYRIKRGRGTGKRGTCTGSARQQPFRGAVPTGMDLGNALGSPRFTEQNFEKKIKRKKIPSTGNRGTEKKRGHTSALKSLCSAKFRSRKGCEARGQEVKKRSGYGEEFSRLTHNRRGS